MTCCFPNEWETSLDRILGGCSVICCWTSEGKSDFASTMHAYTVNLCVAHLVHWKSECSEIWVCMHIMQWPVCMTFNGCCAHPLSSWLFCCNWRGDKVNIGGLPCELAKDENSSRSAWCRTDKINLKASRTSWQCALAGFPSCWWVVNDTGRALHCSAKSHTVKGMHKQQLSIRIMCCMCVHVSLCRGGRGVPLPCESHILYHLWVFQRPGCGPSCPSLLTCDFVFNGHNWWHSSVRSVLPMTICWTRHPVLEQISQSRGRKKAVMGRNRNSMGRTGGLGREREGGGQSVGNGACHISSLLLEISLLFSFLWNKLPKGGEDETYETVVWGDPLMF